jgi:hypothetical protein
VFLFGIFGTFLVGLKDLLGDIEGAVSGLVAGGTLARSFVVGSCASFAKVVAASSVVPTNSESRVEEGVGVSEKEAKRERGKEKEQTEWKRDRQTHCDR